MKKYILIFVMILSSILLYSSNKKIHSISKNIKPKKIITKGSISESGYLDYEQSDYYEIDCGAGWITLNLSVGSNADIDLYLYDSDGNTVASSEGWGYGVDESIDYYAESGIYEIEVYCYDVDGNGNDYYYTLTGTYPDPGYPDLVVTNITINATENSHDHTVYTPAWNPCSVTARIQNNGNSNADDFYVALLYIDPITGNEEMLDVEWVPNLYSGHYEDITFEYYEFEASAIYDYHDSADPSLVHLYARVDYYDDIDEENENNNDSSQTGKIYFIEHATENNYGWCAGTNDISFNTTIAGVYGESRSDHFHNAIDEEATNNSKVYSISSGLYIYHYNQQVPNNSYVEMDIYDGNGKRFIYFHTTNPQYDYDPHPYRNSGIYLADVTLGHIHFVDRTGTGGSTKNPLRSDGIIRYPEHVAPQVSAIRLYLNNNQTPNWDQTPVAGTDLGGTTVDLQVHHDFEIVADAADNLGYLHGGTTGYTKGIYSIGYILKNSQNQILINEPDRIVFNSLPGESHFHRIYAQGSTDVDFYYIVTNTLSSSDGSLNLSGYPNGSYQLEVIAKDIDGNEGSLTFNFTITGSTDVDDNEIVSFINDIYQNYPNPFNPTTTISYNLANDIKKPKIEIYNLKGQKVKTFVLEEKTGKGSITWNGKNEQNKKVASGVYLYRLVNRGKTVQTKKMLLLK